jgi:hypothetical protein
LSWHTLYQRTRLGDYGALRRIAGTKKQYKIL